MVNEITLFHCSTKVSIFVIDEYRDHMSYPILHTKPITHCMRVQDYLFYTHRHKVFTDSQMSWIKYDYYINNVSKD
jgi:hypothetical protein